jgi:hypothetical protein
MHCIIDCRGSDSCAQHYNSPGTNDPRTIAEEKRFYMPPDIIILLPVLTPPFPFLFPNCPSISIASVPISLLRIRPLLPALRQLRFQPALPPPLGFRLRLPPSCVALVPRTSILRRAETAEASSAVQLWSEGTCAPLFGCLFDSRKGRRTGAPQDPQPCRRRTGRRTRCEDALPILFCCSVFFPVDSRRVFRACFFSDLDFFCYRH